MEKLFRYISCKYTALLVVCIFLCTSAAANTVAHCDSLIKKGIDAMWEKQHGRSIELLTQAKILAERNNWYEQLFLANNNLGANYYAMLDYGEALNYYLESYTIAVKELKPKHEMVVLNNIAIVYSKEKNYDKAKEYFQKAYDIAKENKDRIKIGLYAMKPGPAGK
jgi:tetratricopeptide (TPR) repeat protein